MPTPDRDPAEEAEEIINESAEIPDEDLLSGTESYEEVDPEVEAGPDEESDEPQELDFEPGSFEEPVEVDAA